MSQARVSRAALIGAVIAVAVAMGGCGETTGLLATGAADKAGTSADQSGQAFNPFSDGSGPAAGAREVIAKPTLADVLAPASRLAEMSYGRADAPVVLVKYMSLTCPYCRKFHAEVFPPLKREFIDTGKVRFILREFPIGKASGTATIALRCAPGDKYLDLYGRFLAQQAAWVSQEVRTDKIGAVAAQVGLTGEQFSACLADKGLAKELNAVKERGRTLGIIGTPNFFINGRLVKKALGLKDLRDIVDPLLAGHRPGTASATPTR